MEQQTTKSEHRFAIMVARRNNNEHWSISGICTGPANIFDNCFIFKFGNLPASRQVLLWLVAGRDFFKSQHSRKPWTLGVIVFYSIKHLETYGHTT